MLIKKFIILSTLFICGFFIYFQDVQASDIIINEIGASTHIEWIEIWNIGDIDVDLKKWKFWEGGVNHTITSTNPVVFYEKLIVKPQEYAVICKDYDEFLLDYPGFSGVVLDSSWGSLLNKGEEIGLKDSDGNFIEQFSYITSTAYSLERINPFEAASNITNWQEHKTGDTLGFVNSNFSTSSLIVDPPTTTPTTTPVVITTTTPATTTPIIDPPTTTPSIDPPTTTLMDWSVLKINEFVSDPISGNEWVELFNISTSSIVVSDFEICDVRETGCKNVTGTIPATGWLVIDLFTASFLNNSGDSVILKDSSGIILDKISYTTSMIAKKGESVARVIDGFDSDTLNDWAITTETTLNTANIINTPVVEIPSTGGGGIGGYIPDVVLNDEEKQIEDIFGIVLNEIFPNPKGSDLAGEFIEIKNTSNKVVDLEGWKIKDMSRTFELDDEIEAGEIFYWKRDLTKIALNNTTPEEVFLISANGIVVDQIKYDKAVEDSSFARNKNGDWKWTTEKTLGVENIFSSNSPLVILNTEKIDIVSTSSTGIIWKIKTPSTGILGEKLLFDVSESVDERGGKISFQWDFGDGIFRKGDIVEYIFSTSGIYSVGIVANSTMGSTDQNSFEIKIDKTLSLNNTGVVVSEVFPNPEGADSREFIEITNFGTNTVDLSGWSLRLQNDNQYFLIEGILIKPNSRLVFYKLATKLSINNTKDQITLLNRDGFVVDLVKFGKSEAGKVYAKQDKNWFWVDTPTPGSKNIITVSAKNIVKPKITKKSYSAKVFYKPLVLSDVRMLDVGANLKTRGVVTILPGVFGTQYFYIFDGEAGIQVYQYKKDFPELKLGDYIEVYGTISESRGVKRGKISGKQTIDILEIQKDIIPTLVELNEVDEEGLGSLLKMSGEITEIKSSFMYLDNDIDEIKVYFKKGADINKKKFQEGDIVEIAGILELLSGEFVVMPRDQADIKVIKSVENLVTVENKGAEDIQKKRVKRYLTTAIFGLAAIILAVLLRLYGSALIKWVKKLLK